MKLKEQRFLVAGAGASGIGAVKLLLSVGAYVTLYDGNKSLQREHLLDKMKQSDIKDFDKVDTIIGDLIASDVENIDVCVISPGISLETPFVTLIKSLNKPIWGEIELAYRCAKGRVIGITGTNGKTTTTALVGAIMDKYFESTFVVGNIGTPYTLMAPKMTDESVTVAEISSFQLETIENFHPVVSAVLNLTPDHLDRHHTMQNYSDIKISITKNQSNDEICVLNYDDEVLRKYAQHLPCKVMFFSSSNELLDGVFMKPNGDIYLADGEKQRKLMNTSEMKLVGVHNAENVMAGIAIADAMNVPEDVYIEVIRNFDAIEHRIEYVDTINNVIYYNDSKGTNTDASIKALEAMSRKTILIAGGYDKGSEYDEWVEAFGDKIKCLVLIGKTKEKIEATARKHGFDNIIKVETLEDAVNVSFENAKEGETVLLSPACASWDMFKSYEERGKLFKEYVKNLKSGKIEE